ncbi:MFS general substrate transporter [Cystobasidium minutum MCA 4210]|uniref:MFS general substrate transporter n=1 Tax=Cystobasidium minutum MCA 4210 TaxID=1397322 RepID=UPI0034CE676A|eukprot:jgi/Rhomi1/47013/CE47012_677
MTPEEKKKFVPPGTILVDWYDENDPALPFNWSTGKLTVVAGLILWLTFSVYAGSSLVTSSFPGLQETFGIGNAEVTTTLSVYVFAYGLGALIFSPLSEIPALGRNPFYSYPMVLFVLFQVGCARTETFYTFCIMRFLTGLMGAPFLATAGASLQDAFTPDKLGALISFWALSAFAAPAIGPIYGNYGKLTPCHGYRSVSSTLICLWFAAAVYLDNYHWPMWLLLIQTGFATALLIVFLPETSHNNILINRAKRLRALTGNENIRSMAEIEQAHLTPNEIFVKAIVRPTEIFLKDPAITYAHLYTAIIYGIYYLFFESYPLVYQGIYGFSFQVSSLGYLAFLVGGLIACFSYLTYCAIKFGPIFKRGEMPVPEQWLDASLVSTLLPPIGCLIYAWTARHSVHWIASLIGVMLFGGANFVTIQCIFSYVLSVYPAYGASLLAGNDFLRSSVAAGLLFAGQPMFKAMGIGGGNSFLAGLLVLGTVGAYVIWYFGATLRARSKFTG